MDRAALTAGTVVAQKYELRDIIGEGGMAQIWRARQLDSGSEVALKFVGPSLVDESQWRKRFVREAKLLEQLGEQSQHVVRVLDHGVADAGPFLAMELLSGESLAARLDGDRRLPAAEVVHIVGQLCKALAVTHAAGVIHRDIKPANIFLHRTRHQDSPTVKLLDFGIAKVRVDSDLTVPTRQGTMLGTPQYMSPEQFLGDTALDGRADLWSVGVVAYRMLVGRSPFSRGPSSELGARIMGQEPPPPSSIVRTLPSELDAWVKKALAKRAVDRFSDAESMALALTDALAVVPRSRASERPRSAGRRARHAKGVNLIDLVKLLRVARQRGQLGGLTPEEEALIDERILVSSWYPIETFWRLLTMAHERLLAGADEAAIELGLRGGERVLGGVHSVFIKGGEMERNLRSLARGWSTYFDFGAMVVEHGADFVRIAIRGYPDMPRVHGLTTLGWFRAALVLIGADVRSARITQEPWSGDAEVLYEFALALPKPDGRAAG